MLTTPISDLDEGGANAPVNSFAVLENFQESDAPVGNGAARLQSEIRQGINLDALVANKSTDILVVAFHGATNRANTTLPRFEWLRTILDLDVSSAYFSDPTLLLDHEMQLSWYTGWEGVDVHQRIANEITKIAVTVGAKKVILTGSSGGGFAALQISALIPDSIAVPFNAQTAVNAYRVNGVSWNVQHHYVKTVWPKISATLTPPGNVEGGGWDKGVDDRLSAVRRYATKRPNRVYMIQNEEEFHYDQHFLPFLRSALASGNDVRPSTNKEGARHAPHSKEIFRAELQRVFAAETAELVPV